MLPHEQCSRPLRIGYLVKRFPRLSETFVLNEILELERTGADVAVFSLFEPTGEPRHEEALRRLKARVIYLDRPCNGGYISEAPDSGVDELLLGKSASAISSLTQKAAKVATFAKRHRWQHLHAHFGNDSTAVAILAARSLGLSTSFTAHAKDIYHTYFDAETDRRVRQAKIAAASFVATVTEANKRHLDAIAGPDMADKIVRVYNGIDLDRFHMAKTEHREKGLLLAVGRLVEKKGYGDLLEAMSIVRNAEPATRLMICGDGPLREEIVAKIKHFDLGDRVTLLGAVDQNTVQRMMQKAAILVLPSLITLSGDRDALPTVLLEAQASGLPVISTSVSGIPEIVEHDVNGLLVPQRDPIALAGAIRRLTGDLQLAMRLAASGRRNALHRFDLRRNVACLRGLFDQSIQQRASKSAVPAPTETKFPGFASGEPTRTATI